MRHLFILALLFFHSFAFAQLSYTYNQETKVSFNGNPVQIPFSGGINAAQFQTLDVNNDGIEELVIWDINTRRLSVFSLFNGIYQYHPEWTYLFPTDINGFLILIDYDQDGKKDLFTSSPLGIRMYKNMGFINNQPQWQLARNFLPLENGSNLAVNNLDIPLLVDIDGDGDLDILTFNFASGDYLEFYKNTSMERTGSPDMDQFLFPIRRWGNFEFCGCGQIAFGTTCGVNLRTTKDRSAERVLHAGGHSLLYEDFNGDGVRDILMGQDECNTLFFIPNKGSNTQPVFENFETNLPEFGALPQFPIFHAAFLWKNQLIISSNTSSSAVVNQSDFAQNIFALNTEMPATKTPFLQNQLLDLGENARPFFKGNVSGGKLIITANSFDGSKVVGKATLFDVLKDEWTLVDKDFLNLSQRNQTDLQYLEHTTSRGQQTYWLSGVERTATGISKKIQTGFKNDLSDLRDIQVPGVNLLTLDHIALFSYQNQDFFLLARQTGELILYDINFQSATPTLSLKERSFLNFRDNPAFRNLSIAVIPEIKPSLYVTNQSGNIQYIEDFMNSTSSKFLEIQGAEKENHRLGRGNWITHLSYPFSGEKDLLLGNTGGGLIYLKENKREGIENGEEFQVKAYPNPSSGSFKLLSNFEGRGTLYNSMGQIIVKEIVINPLVEIEFDLSKKSAGVYYLLIHQKNEGSKTLKILITK